MKYRQYPLIGVSDYWHDSPDPPYLADSRTLSVFLYSQLPTTPSIMKKIQLKKKDKTPVFCFKGQPGMGSFKNDRRLCKFFKEGSPWVA